MQIAGPLAIFWTVDPVPARGGGLQTRGAFCGRSLEEDGRLSRQKKDARSGVLFLFVTGHSFR